jgi:GNAT superfamily N-acetyltransferase
VQRETAYLTMLHVANDRGSLAALLEALAEHLHPQGVRTLVGPTHLLPHLGGGALVSHWHLPPPVDTPYAPPYLGEHLEALLHPVGEAHLFGLEAAPAARQHPVQVAPFELPRLASDLLPLFQAATTASPTPSPPDEAEVRATLTWWAPHRPFGLLALAGEAPVGFALLYEDAATRSLRFKAPKVQRGRLLGGVLPAFRRQGVGRALLGSALAAARTCGWQHLSIGPVPTASEAEVFLKACGALPAQRYRLYSSTL